MHDCAGTQQKLMDVSLGELPEGGLEALLAEVERCGRCAEWRLEVDAALSRVDEALDLYARADDSEFELSAAVRRRITGSRGLPRFWYYAAGMAAAAGLALWFASIPPPRRLTVANIPVPAVEAPAMPSSRLPRKLPDRPARLPRLECQSWVRSAPVARVSSEESDEKATSDVVRELMGFDETPPSPGGDR